jgi:hypothetical protein
MVKIFYVRVSHHPEYKQLYIPKRHYLNDIYSGDEVYGLWGINRPVIYYVDEFYVSWGYINNTYALIHILP